MGTTTQSAKNSETRLTNMQGRLREDQNKNGPRVQTNQINKQQHTQAFTKDETLRTRRFSQHKEHTARARGNRRFPQTILPLRAKSARATVAGPRATRPTTPKTDKTKRAMRQAQGPREYKTTLCCDAKIMAHQMTNILRFAVARTKRKQNKQQARECSSEDKLRNNNHTTQTRTFALSSQLSIAVGLVPNTFTPARCRGIARLLGI